MAPLASPTVRLVCCCVVTSHCYGSYQRHSV